MSSVPPRYEESPLSRARRVVELNLKGGDPAPADLAWLHQHPILWLRALTAALRDVDHKVHESRAVVESLKPTGNKPGSPLYLAAVERHKEETKEYTRIRHRVQQRIDAVKTILGPEPVVGHMIWGDLVALMIDFADKAQAGRIDELVEKALFWADRFTEQDIHGTKEERNAALQHEGATA